MSLTHIARAALQTGNLVYGYRQASSEYNFKDIGPWGETRKGYCAALTFVWVKARLNGDDLPYDATTHEAQKPDWTITRLHNLTKDLGYPPVLAELGLKSNGEITLEQPADGSSLFAEIKNRADGCYAISYRKKPKGGHMVAIQRAASAGSSGGTNYRYFDANHGHFSFASGDDFLTWLTSFIQDSGYKEKYDKAMRIQFLSKA